MNWREQYKSLLWMLGIFLFAYFLPLENTSFTGAVLSALELAKWYAREHVLLCLIPAFFIAGVIAVFISKNAVIKYLGGNAKKWLAYLMASVAGSVLAVCSCTVLPLFSGIHKRGAGLGPAVTFLYSGPAINILAMILTARVLGLELGIARVVGAVSFSIIIGLLMSLIYRREEQAKAAQGLSLPEEDNARPLWQTVFHFTVLVAILVFANWGRTDATGGLWHFLYASKWLVTAGFGILFTISLIFVLKLNKIAVMAATIAVVIAAILSVGHPLIPFTLAVVLLTAILSFSEGEANEWLSESWGFAKQILPLLAMGILAAGFLLGSGDSAGIIPAAWIVRWVGGNSLFANFFASFAGALMYFATLTEIPILQGLIAGGMGKGPALALLLAGPALSLPNMLVIRSVIGTQKTAVFVSLVIVMSTLAGMLYGWI